MPTLTVDGHDLRLHLTALEKLGAMHGDLQIPLTAVRSATVTNQPWRERRGMRAPGTGVPGVIMLGTSRGGFGKDFCAIYGRRPAVLVELESQPFKRLLVHTADPEADAAAVNARI